MSEIKELGTIFVHNRIWVDPDPNSLDGDDGNPGTFEKPLQTYEVAQRYAGSDDIIIVRSTPEQPAKNIFVHKRIWVDKDHPRSDDANAGTRESPLKTYETAYRRADPGDYIIVVQRDDTRTNP